MAQSHIFMVRQGLNLEQFFMQSLSAGRREPTNHGCNAAGQGGACQYAIRGVGRKEKGEKKERDEGKQKYGTEAVRTAPRRVQARVASATRRCENTKGGSEGDGQVHEDGAVGNTQFSEKGGNNGGYEAEGKLPKPAPRRNW